MKIKKTGRLLCLLFFSLFSFGAFSQAISVSGVITDAAGEKLVGVSVVQSGSSNGTMSDINGNFSIKVPANGSLKFSYLGYLSKVIEIQGKTFFNVILDEDDKALQEVVVVGYGVQRKEAVTGSVSSIGGEIIRDIPTGNISRALQGRIAGVEMSQTSSKPGSSMQIRIRGTRSLNASNDPLVVLDGIPFAGQIGDIDPASIKSVDILKDASATAIYGSRGANGVILVTSNKGKVGQKAKATYTGYTGSKEVFARYPMMTGPEFVALRKASNQYQNTLDESDDANTDWQELLYKTGVVQSHDLAIAGGTQKGNFNFGVGYYKDEAVVPLQDYTRYSYRASFDQGIGEYLKFGFSSQNSFSIQNGNNLGAVYAALARSPIAVITNQDGSLKDRILEQTSGKQFVSTRSVLEGLGDKYIDQTRAFGTYNSMYGEVKIPGIEGLKYRMNVGLDLRASNGGNYTGEGVFSGTPTTPSTASINNSLTTHWQVENLLTFDRVFNDVHNLNVVALYSSEQSKYNSSSVSAKDIPADFFQFYNLGRANGEITVNPAWQAYNMSGLLSWMGRAMYSYNDQYMLSLTMRSDASSRLAPGHQRHTYPAISAGWNIKKESFMEDFNTINMMKLRAGYGQTSNQSVDPYKTLGLLSTVPYNFGTTYSTGYYVSELPNPNLGWEYSKTWNIGLDFALLDNRLSGTFEYYIQNTHDVLLSVGLPKTAGVSSYMANIGETQNKGVELSLDGIIIDNLNGWTWEAGLNVYSNKNKLVALASGRKKDEGNLWFVGNSIDVIYDYTKIGLWQEGDPYFAELEPGGNVGMIKVKYNGPVDENGKPTRAIGADDREVLEVNPDFQGGFNTKVSYKGFDLSAIGTFKSGGILISSLYAANGYLNNLNSRSGNNVKVDFWTPENTDAKYPKPNGVGGDNPKYGSTLGYFDASYLKIRTIALGYNFNQSFVKNLGIEKVRLYCTVENPFVMFSPYNKESGMDPEPNSYGNENVAVAGARRLLIVGTNTPSTRNYLVGLNVTF